MEYTIKFKNNSDSSLAGVLHSPAEHSNAGIIFLHGFAGKKDENGLFPYAANILSQNGYHALRFDFAGAGESQGDYLQSTLKSQKNDFLSAVDFFIKKYSLNKVGIIGFSLGATIALLGYDRRIKAMALWSPVLFPKTDMHPRYQVPEIKKQLRKNGYIDKAGLRVGTKIIKDLGKANLIPHIKRVNCEVLLVHGDKDERIDYRNTLKAESFFKYATTIIIENAGHSYKESFLDREKVITKTTEFFDKYLLNKTSANISV